MERGASGNSAARTRTRLTLSVCRRLQAVSSERRSGEKRNTTRRGRDDWRRRIRREGGAELSPTPHLVGDEPRSQLRWSLN